MSNIEPVDVRSTDNENIVRTFRVKVKRGFVFAWGETYSAWKSGRLTSESKGPV